jgi:hypothetical protein
MIEGSGSGFTPLTRGFGSGSRSPKNIWIRRIRIRNTEKYPHKFDKHPSSWPGRMSSCRGGWAHHTPRQGRSYRTTSLPAGETSPVWCTLARGHITCFTCTPNYQFCGSGYIRQRYGSGSGSGSGSGFFYHQAKRVSKKNLDFYCFVSVTSFWLFIFENDLQVPSKSKKQKTF